LLSRRDEVEVFWALQDVSFDVPRGVALGIIGGNGAGKSTLLKILSRIILPTKGEVEVCGKVNSLLEVGTGFQPELSGRENIYLNGSILGMSRREIDLVFDEIVDFSGVGEFIDMPVKHYSSGMYSRLAFSVGANVTGDILLIDEVLAVGDAEFRKKCLRRMDDLLASERRTVLFVSHSMESVLRFCTKVLWLDRGQVRAFGDSEDVVSEYLRQANRLSAKYVLKKRKGQQITGTAIDARSSTWGTSLVEPISTEAEAGFTPAATITSVLVLENSQSEGAVIRQDIPVAIAVEFEISSATLMIHPVVHLHCLPRAGVPEVTHVFTCVGDSLPQVLGHYRQYVEIPANLLTVGQYSISVALVTRSKPLIKHCKLERIITFQIIAPRDYDGTFLLEQLHGVIQPQIKWHLERLETLRQ
jgi:ABC-type polysaccharide/polyol phosphate transport system ATPase subunit